MREYQLSRSKRKSLSIVIKKDGTIQVKAPDWLPECQIDQFVQKKAGWIEEKRSELSALEQKKILHTFQKGDHFFFLGEDYQLQVQKAIPGLQAEAAGGIILDQKEKTLSVTLGSPKHAEVKGQMEQWYIRQARKIFPERVGAYYPAVAQAARKAAIGEIGSVNRIVIRNQKTRWGRCSSKRNLNFNWRLVMAPQEILDYIVVHELCHLAYLDHSRQFWQLVEVILPDYMQRRNWLRVNGGLLEWETE